MRDGNFDFGDRTAKHLSQQMPQKDNEYQTNIVLAARYLIECGYGDSVYDTQWESGSSCWSGNNSEKIIKRELLPNVFEPFEQCDRCPNRKLASKMHIVHGLFWCGECEDPNGKSESEPDQSSDTVKIGIHYLMCSEPSCHVVYLLTAVDDKTMTASEDEIGTKCLNCGIGEMDKVLVLTTEDRDRLRRFDAAGRHYFMEELLD